MTELIDIARYRNAVRNAERRVDDCKRQCQRAPWNEVFKGDLKDARADLASAKRLLDQAEQDYIREHQPRLI